MNDETVATPHRLLSAVERARILDGAAEAVAKPLRRFFGGHLSYAPGAGAFRWQFANEGGAR
ncbi:MULTISPECIES: hypothetical protein [Amycolatopsis]|uniref:hypothetical protein n=1 Tax=Amycolatopsis TaxID=1813 RepID=UPI0017481567|nr:hypothetical protein [Amycolatopsis bullii]